LKFSIVTPSYNSERFIGETIESVLSQKGDFSIQYIIVDNFSTDKTIEIVKKYQKMVLNDKILIKCREVKIELISEKDNGMYDAIKKGFDRATGEVFAWINSDDIYLHGAFDIIQRTLGKYPQILWLKGITSYINENSTIYSSGQCYIYLQEWIRNGLYGTELPFIQQDSVFWRSELWLKSGGINNALSLSGDFFLWKIFSKLEPLYSLNAYISCFRKVAGQKSENIKAYLKEIELQNGTKAQKCKKVRHYFSFEHLLPNRLRPLYYHLIFGNHKYYLITLDKATEPILRIEDYNTIKKILKSTS
jgi:glycosyltransferase involved in cell wall biosynthesis